MRATEHPVEAAALIQETGTGLSRYQKREKVLVRVRGRLEDVRTLNSGEAWIIVRDMAGRPAYEMTTATIPEPGPHVDQVLQGIGVGGDIVLVGEALASTDLVHKLEMEPVHAINGVNVKAKPET